MAWTLGQLDKLLPPLEDTATRGTPRTRDDGTDAAFEPLAPPRDIPERLLERVGEAPCTSDKEKRSGQTFALVMMCIEAGWSVGVTLGFLIDYNHRPSVSRGINRLARDVAGIYAKHDHIGESCLMARCLDATAPLATAVAMPYDAGEEVSVTLARILSAVDGYPWSGQAGRTSAAVMAAHVATAARAGSLTYDASSRVLGPMAGVDRKTVESHNRDRLVPGGWLEVHDNRRRSRDALTYTLRMTHCGPHQSQGGARPATGSCGPNQSRADVFRYGRNGRGKTFGAICNALEVKPMTKAELQAHVRCAPSTAGKHLRWMQERGMVKDVSGTWHWQGVGWEALGDELGSNGTTARQVARHEAERLQMRLAERTRTRRRILEEQHGSSD